MTSFPHGDPEGIRALASALRQSAERVGEGASLVQHHAYALTFEGPAAKRFKAEVHDRHQQAFGIVTRLNDLAVYLDGAASQAQQQIADDAKKEQEAADHRGQPAPPDPSKPYHAR